MIRGVGIASLICGSFGCLWLLVGLGLLNAGRQLPWLTVTLAGSALIVAASVAMIVMGRPKPGDPARPEINVKALRILNTVQWMSIALCILLLNVLHQVTVIPWVLSVVVGVHFIPMGIILRLLSYKVLGAVIIVMDLALLAWPPPMRYAYAALGTGLALFGAVAYWMLWLLFSVQLRNGIGSSMHQTEKR